MRGLLVAIGLVALACFLACSGGPSGSGSGSGGAGSAGGKPTGKLTAAKIDPRGVLSVYERAQAERFAQDDQDYIRRVLDSGTLPELSAETMDVGDLGTFPRGVEVMQVLGRDSFLASFPLAGYETATVLFRGVGTGGMVDGRSYNLSGDVFRVVDPQAYGAVLGQRRTVLAVERIDVAAGQALLANHFTTAAEGELQARTAAAAEQEQAAADEAAAKAAANRRTWHAAEGSFSVEAEFRGMAGGIVRLKRADSGEEIRVPLATLSDEDREWIEAKR